MPGATVIEPALRCDLPALSRRLRVPARRQAELAALVRAAEAVARPKALCRTFTPVYGGEDRVALGGVSFASVQLCAVLKQAAAIHPYLATCGPELAAWAASVSGQLHGYWADAIMQDALDAALYGLESRLGREHGSALASVEPGLFEDWPVTEQTKIHALLGDTAGSVGVELNAQCMMTPLKSLSGFMFPVPEKPHRCSLCANERCPERTRPPAR
jgi:hypothetical protein